MLLSCSHIEKSFGENRILSDVTFSMEPGQKFAIVGSNGTGKTTLLRILTGDLAADSGTVSFSKGASFGYLEQHPKDVTGSTVYEYVLSSCERLLTMEARLLDLESRMEGASDELFAEYTSLSEQFDRAGGHTFRSEISGILKGLSFSEEEFGKPLSALSGGERTRAALAGLLATKPDLLILDEPVNHLDLSAIEWLEGFLTGYRKAVLVVAHDRYFLDKVCGHVVDLSYGQCHVYPGNYTQYVRQKEERELTLAREYEKQQAEIAHQEAVIARLRSFNREKSIRRADSRQKMLDKMELLDTPRFSNAHLTMSFSGGERSGNDVLSVEHLTKGFDGRTLFSDTSFLLTRQERAAVIGDNGTGKTTLLKILHGDLAPDSGDIRFGAQLTVGYYDQAQQGLSDDKTVFMEISDAYPTFTETQIRSALAGFLFTGDDVFKPIRALSGGERARAALLKLVLSDANLLILDEPTNHLDMDTKEILEDALLSFPGTLLFVSHDRYFIRKIATRILELENGAFTDYRGGYEDYLAEKARQRASEAASAAAVGTSVLSGFAGAESATDARKDWEQQKSRQAALRRLQNRLEKTETEIARAEEQLSELSLRYEDPVIASDAAKLNEIYQQEESLKQLLTTMYEEWERLSEELEHDAG